MNYEENFLGWLIGHDYFVQGKVPGDYEYFSDRQQAFQFAQENKPAKVYRIPKGSEFYGEEGRTPAITDPTRDVGNATLIARVR